MALGHQFIIIARVGDMKQYRVLATARHQYLAGYGPVKRCLKLIETFSAPAQRWAVQTELDFAAAYFSDATSDDHEYVDGGPKTTRALFPFILNCLMIGTASSPFNDSVHFGYNIANDAASEVPDNHEGITVVDISELDRIRHCFVNFRPLQSQCLWEDLCDEQELYPQKEKTTYEEAMKDIWARQPPLCTPLTAWQYMVGHLRIRSVNEEAIGVGDTLGTMPLLGAEVLANAWPGDNWNLPGGVEGVKAPWVKVHTGPATLVEQSINKFIDNVFSSNEFDTELLDEPRLIPGFQPSFRKYLLRPGNNKRLAQHPRAAKLLQFAFAGESHLSWAQFDNLSAEVIRNALQGGELEAARSISLSIDKLVYSAPEELAEALFASNGLREFYLMSRPTRRWEDDEASARLFITLSSSPCIAKDNIKLVISGACSCAATLDLWLPMKHRVSVAPAYPVLQLITASNLPWKTREWGGNEGAETFYLGDSLLSPQRIVTGLFHYMHDVMVTWSNVGSGRGTGFVACFAFASAAASLEDSTRLEITTVPVETYTISKAAATQGRGHGCCSELRDLAVGSWTVLVEVDSIRVEHDIGLKMRFKYAFVRPKRTIHVDPESQDAVTEDDIEIADAEAFLKITTPQLDSKVGLRKLLKRLQKTDEERIFRVDLDQGERLVSDMTPSEAVRVIKRSISYTPLLRKRITKIKHLKEYKRESETAITS